MKLFFIGKGQRGKTTLLHRLKENSAEKTDRTVGIEIEDWECRGEKKIFSKFRSTREPIKFIAWDFAGQVSGLGMEESPDKEKGGNASVSSLHMTLFIVMELEYFL